MEYPLSYYKYKEFPALDKEELTLICNGALDLVLIEDASEVIRLALHRENIFEKILENIVSTNPDYEFIRSETFPFYMNYNTKQKHYPDRNPSSLADKEMYNETINSYREVLENINKNKKLVTILGTSLGNSGGHYAAFHYENGIVSIFDSMQIENKRTARSGYKSLGYYTAYFIQLAQDLFPKSQVIVPDCIKDQLAIQLTGGFSEGQPLAVRDSTKLADKDKILLSIQSTESQNHFCYLWAIWYIHLKVSDISVEDVMNKLFTKIDPLVSIKRYAWCLVELLKIKIDPRFQKFFYAHFLSIWSNVPLGNKLSHNFARYSISRPKKCANISDVLLESLTPIKLIREENTPIPKGFC